MSLLGDEFADQLSLEELGFVDGALSDTNSVENICNQRPNTTKSTVDTPEGAMNAKDELEGLGSDIAGDESGVESTTPASIVAVNEQEGKGGETRGAEGESAGGGGVEDDVGDGEREGAKGGAPEPRAMDVEEPEWDALGDCIAMPAWKVKGWVLP